MGARVSPDFRSIPNSLLSGPVILTSTDGMDTYVHSMGPCNRSGAGRVLSVRPSVLRAENWPKRTRARVLTTKRVVISRVVAIVKRFRGPKLIVVVRRSARGHGDPDPACSARIVRVRWRKRTVTKTIDHRKDVPSKSHNAAENGRKKKPSRHRPRPAVSCPPDARSRCAAKHVPSRPHVH